MGALARIGEPVLRFIRHTLNAAGLLFGVLVLAVRPRTWRRTVGRVFVRQILFTGVDGLALTLLVALLTGVSIVAPAYIYLSTLGESEISFSILVVAMVRAIGPVLIGFIVVGRSGTAIAAELASMREHQEVELLESMGIEPMEYLIVPRVLALPIAMFCLTEFFLIAAFSGGWVFSVLLSGSAVSPAAFADRVFGSMSAVDILTLVSVTVLSGLATGAVCCQEGINTTGTATDVPRAVGKSVVRSVAAILLISSILSLLSHV